MRCAAASNVGLTKKLPIDAREPAAQFSAVDVKAKGRNHHSVHSRYAVISFARRTCYEESTRTDPDVFHSRVDRAR